MQKAWTITAILTAHKNAAPMTKQGYVAVPLGYQDFYLVISPDGMRYRVSPSRPTCNCKQCVAEGYCKHIVWVAEFVNDRNEQLWEDEQYAKQAEQYEAMMDERGQTATERIWKDLGI